MKTTTETIYDLVWQQVNCQFKTKILNQVYDTIMSRVRGTVCNSSQVYGQVYRQVRSKVMDTVEQQVRDQILENAYDKLRAKSGPTFNP